MADSTLKSMIDSHCHLDLACFSDDIDAVITRAIDVGVEHFIIPGIDPTHWQQSQALAQRYTQISYTLGYHPYFIPHSLTHADIPVLIDILKQAINTSCVGIGEIGIDRTLDLPIDIQIALFDAQLLLAQQLELPVIIHHRKSHDLIIGRLKRAQFSSAGIIHAFSGNQVIAQEYIDLGFCLGVGGTITYPRGEKTRQAIQAVGLEHCVLETDSPDMPMYGRQGQRNEPQYLVDVVKVLERMFVGQDVVGTTNENVQRLFHLSFI